MIVGGMNQPNKDTFDELVKARNALQEQIYFAESGPAVHYPGGRAQADEMLTLLRGQLSEIKHMVAQIEADNALQQS